MANTTDKSILTAAGKALLAQLNAEEKPLIIDKMIFANVADRAEFPQSDDVVPTDDIVHQEQVEQRGRLSADSVIYSSTLTSDVGPFEFNWTGAYCSEYGVLVTIDHHALTPKTADEPGVAGNTLVRSVVLEYKDIAEITNITVDASSWQYNATDRMKKMDSDVAQSIIDQNGKDWFIEDGFLMTPSGSAYNIKAGAGYVSGNRVSMEFDRSVQVPNKPSFIYIDAHREGTPTGEQVTLFDFVITAEEKDDYIDSSTGKDIPHFVCKIAEVLAGGSVSDLRPEGENKQYVKQSISDGTYLVAKTVSDMIQGLSTGLGVVVPMHGQNWSTQAYLIVDDEKSKLGGGEYIYDANKPKSHHDGGIVISPTVPFDGTLGKLPNFLSGVGETDPEGVGCFVRKLTDYEMPEMWGAQGDGESDDIYPISSADKSSPSRHIKYRPVVYAMGNHPDHPQGFSPSRDRTTHEGVGFSWTGESGHTIFKYIGQINDVFALLKLSRAHIGYDTNSSRNYHVKNIKLDCNGRCGFGLYENYAGDDSVAENIVIINSRYRAGHVVKSWYNSIQNIVAYKNYGSGLSFGIPLDDLIPDTTEVLDVNGFDITKPRAHSNGRQLPNETTLEWEARRFNEMENRVATWGIGIGFVHGYNQSNPVSEHNYGPGIYRTNAGGSDTRGLVSTGGYVERNCEAARADGVSTKNWEVWHDGENSSTRGEKFTGLWFNPDLSGESGSVKIAGTPKTTNKNQLVKFEKCPNISIPDPEHEQYTNDSDSGGGSMPNPFVAQYQTMGVSSSAFTLRDPRDGSSNQFALFRYNASSAYENSKAVEVLPRGNDQVALRISMNATTGGTDGQSDLGNPSMRWKGGYFVDSPAGTSDETQKTDFKAIPAGYVDTLCDIADELGVWRWIAAIAEKGDKARYHVGPTAQEVYRKFQAIGIDAFKYGFVGKDPLTEMVKVGEQKNEDGTYSPVYESKPVVDDEGNQKEIWNIRHIELLYAMQWASMQKLNSIVASS